MKLQDFLSGRIATAIGVTLSRLLPPRAGYALARFIANYLSSRQGSPLVEAVRANQWVISEGQASPEQIDQRVRGVFVSSAYSMYEFWHYFRNQRAILNMVEFDPSFEALVARSRHSPNGTLLVTPHVSNFDLVGRALVLHGMPLHILSYPQPPGGYKVQNMIREFPGMKVTPMSIAALRQASETLRAGGTVATGVDRPLPDEESPKYRPRFFGHPSSLPVFYVRLALKHDLPISVALGLRKAAGCYRILASEPIVMQRSADLMEETIQNAEAVLAVIADLIRKVPEQWAMFYPVWPEMIGQIPPSPAR